MGIWSSEVYAKPKDKAFKPKGNVEDVSLNAQSYKKPNFPILLLSLASIIIGYDYLASASEIQESIDNLKNASKTADVSTFESSKHRKEIVGLTCLIGGVISAMITFKDVSIRTNSNSISMSYRF